MNRHRSTVGRSFSSELGRGVTGQTEGGVMICARVGLPTEEDTGEGNTCCDEGGGSILALGKVVSRSENEDSGNPKVKLCEHEVSGERGLSISLSSCLQARIAEAKHSSLCMCSYHASSS